jgi:hypothetical protein
MLEGVDHEELVAPNCRARHLKRMGVPVAMAEADADRFDCQVAALVQRGCRPGVCLAYRSLKRTEEETRP